MKLNNRSAGPRPRDELAAWTTATLRDEPLGDIPPLDAPSPEGRVFVDRGQGVYYRRTDGANDAPRTWYVHGLEGMSRNWDRLAAALSPYSTGFAPDLPGSGQSAPPHGRYRLLDETDLLARMITRLAPGPVHLVGNSRGGMVATLLAARHPQLVRTLTLISPAVPDFRLTHDRGADVRLGLVLLPGIVGRAERMLRTVTPAQRAKGLAAMCFGEPELLRDADIAMAEASYRQRGLLPWAYRDSIYALRSLLWAQLRRGRWSFAAAARRVRVPVLVVWGTRDRLVDVRLARATAARFADARLLVLARTGHVAQMERPAATAQAMLALWHDAQPSGASRPDTHERVAP